MVALTFDDGPDAVATPPLLDLLEARGVPATFFVLGAHAEAHPGLVHRMLAAGHAVQPHAWDWDSHGRHIELAREEMKGDVGRTVEAIVALGCPRPVMWRPPNGDVDDPKSYEVARALGLALVTWTLQTCDWSERHAPERILADIDSRARDDAALEPGSVVLMHDKPETARLLAGLLDRIDARGLRAGPMPLDGPATARGGEYRFGRRDGRTPCEG